jgi:signal transduction histidine kinase
MRRAVGDGVRGRLLSILLVLMGLVLLALGVPLGRSLADRQQQDMFLDRLGDTTRFASQAGQASGPVDLGLLREGLVRYQSVYGATAAVLAPDGAVLAVSGSTGPLGLDEVRQRVANAAAGRLSDVPGFAWPWDDRPLVVAEPVYRAGDVVGVAVTVSPTDRMRAAVLRGWAAIAGIALVGLVLFVLAATRLTAWVLRPVRRLDAAAHTIATGDLDARVAADTGPPELRRLASAFNEMTDALAAALEQQRAFVANASHQLRNPLGALLLRVEHAAMEASPEVATELAEAEEEGRRLSRVLDDLLAVARLENARAEPRRLDAVALLADRVRNWRVVAAKRGIDLMLEPTPGAWVVADPTALGSCLDAILDNALKFSGEGTTVRVTVRDVPGADPRMVDLAVADEGPGLDAGELARVGERFWRGARDQNEPGSGLGLSIVRTLMDPYGGRLHVEPGAARGLVVAVRLPTDR